MSRGFEGASSRAVPSLTSMPCGPSARGGISGTGTLVGVIGASWPCGPHSPSPIPWSPTSRFLRLVSRADSFLAASISLLFWSSTDLRRSLSLRPDPDAAAAPAWFVSFRSPSVSMPVSFTPSPSSSFGSISMAFLVMASNLLSVADSNLFLPFSVCVRISSKRLRHSSVCLARYLPPAAAALHPGHLGVGPCSSTSDL